MSEFWGQFFQNEPYRPYQQHEIHKYWLLLPFWLLASLLSHFPKSCCWHLGVQPQVLVTAVMLGMLGFAGHQPFLGTCNGSDLDPTWSYLSKCSTSTGPNLEIEVWNFIGHNWVPVWGYDTLLSPWLFDDRCRGAKRDPRFASWFARWTSRDTWKSRSPPLNR